MRTIALILFATGIVFGQTHTLGKIPNTNQPTAYSPGAKQTFAPDGTNAGLNVGSRTSDPSSGSNGDIYYNSTTHKLRCFIDGAWGDCDTTATGEPGTGDIEAVGVCDTGACFQAVTQNWVLASPDGSSGQMGPRALVAADIPALPYTTDPTTNVGDLIVRTGAGLVRLPKGGANESLLGGTTSPTWGLVPLNNSGAVTGILRPVNGGTGIAFVKFAGPTVERTYTLPDSDATVEFLANKNAANGYAGLDANTRLDPTRLPAFTGDATSSAGTATLALATKHKTWTKSIQIPDPVAGDSLKYRIVLPSTSTVTKVACHLVGGTSLTVNFDKRTEAAPDTAGTNLLGTALTCTAGNATQSTTTITSASVTAGAPAYLAIASVTGTPTFLYVDITGTVD